MLRLAVLTSLLVAPAGGCKATGSFTCETSDQCRLGGVFGTCETNGFCSFTDSSCASGSRYDDLAGGGLAGVCVGDEMGPDAMPVDQAPADPRCSLWQPAPELFDPCGVPMPGGDLTLTAAGSPYTYDTTDNGGVLKDQDGTVIAVNAGVLLQTGGPNAAVASVESLSIETNAVLFVIGSKPLLMVVWTDANIAGVVDVGSHFGGQPGAGSNPSACTALASGADGVSTGGSGGGGGGGFQGAGGTGGMADAPANLSGGPGGPASATAPSVLRGGCTGGRSGKAGTSASVADPNAVSLGGDGGGAIRFAIQSHLTVSGAIIAGGGGGAGTIVNEADGGGGGGSGGYIGLEASIITLIAAKLVANGGGGASGAPFIGTGNHGVDGQPSATPAPGGAAPGGSCGLAGASGSGGATLGGTNGQGVDACGGAGGGGGAGWILVRAPTFTPNGATISPAPTVTAP